MTMKAPFQPNMKHVTGERQAWKRLEAHYKKVSTLHLRQLFAEDPARGERMAVEAVGLYLDYSKNRITGETVKLLLQLAEESGLQTRIEALFCGEKINVTEKRAVLHVALRAPKRASIVVDGEDVVPKVHAVLDKMAGFSDHVRSGEWKGHTGKRIRNVINIGIGGSHRRPGLGLHRRHQSNERPITVRVVSKNYCTHLPGDVGHDPAPRPPFHGCSQHLTPLRN